MSSKSKVSCRTTNLYVCAYLNYLHLYKRDNEIRFIDVVNDETSKFGNGKPKKAFRFEVKSVEYFNELVDGYFNSEFKCFVDSLKQVIPVLNASVKIED